MNIGYLLSILDLYLIKEKNSSLIVEVDNRESLVKVDFCYSFCIYYHTPYIRARCIFNQLY